MGSGLAFVALGLLLMHGLDVRSGWTALLPGQIFAGIGLGLTNPALASTAVGVAPPAQSGMASGANNTARQLGIATGIAALGAIFQHKIHVVLESVLAATPAAGHTAQLAHAAATGSVKSALATRPLAVHAAVERATHQAFVSAFNEIVLVALAVAIAGYSLVRTRDLLASARAQRAGGPLPGATVGGAAAADAHAETVATREPRRTAALSSRLAPRHERNRRLPSARPVGLACPQSAQLGTQPRRTHQSSRVTKAGGQ